MENIVIILIGVCALYSNAQNVPANEVCLTKDCVKEAAQVLENMDANVDPCDDFYEFACGGFEEETFIQPYQVHVNEMTKLQDKVLEKLVSIFEDSPSPGEPEIFESVRNLYKSCMDIDDIEKNSVNYLKSLLEQVGGYPVLKGNNWNETEYNFIDVALKLQSLGLKGSMFVDLKLNYKSDRIEMKEVDTGIPKENAFKGPEDNIVQAHLRYLIDMAKFLGASHETAEKDMRDVLNLKIRIENINSSSEMGWKEIKDIPTVYPNIQWVDLINNYLNTDNLSAILFAQGDMMEKNNSIYVATSASYLDTIKEILSNTSKRTLANFQISQSIPMADLTPEALEILDSYEKVTEGIREREPRWKMCLHSIGDYGNITNFLWVGLRIATGAMYVNKYFNNETKPIINDIIQNVINEFDTILKEIDWMDEDTRNKARELIQDIKFHIGYSKDLLNNTIIDEFYKGLQFSPKGFLKNKIKMSKYFAKKYNTMTWRDGGYWMVLGSSDEVTAYFYHNEIFLSAAIFGGSFFGPNRPLYMNYGAMGIVIGHEVTHAIDRNLAYRWDYNDTKEIYINKTKCVIDEYGNYVLAVDGKEIHVNGEKTKVENVADIIGNRIAYRTYQKLSSSLQEGVLPGLPFSPNQLFWLAVANLWCSKNRPEYIIHSILKDEHTPNKFRINGPLSNLEEFSKDWKCPVGSKMNPAEKCIVW